MNYIQIVVFLCIEGHFLFFVSIFGCHNCSYSAILIVFYTFIIQFYDTLSLSLLHVHWILLLNKNITFMVFIKQLKPRIFVQYKCCYRTGALPCKVVVGSIPFSARGLTRPRILHEISNHAIS